jgi:hypothetical protein
MIPPRTSLASVISRSVGPSYLVWGLAGNAGMLTHSPRIRKVDVPDQVAEEVAVKSTSTEASDDEDRKQRPHHRVSKFQG